MLLDLRFFSDSDFNCPQAAKISSPRVVRIGAEMPLLKIISENFAILVLLGRSKDDPGQGLKGIKLTLAGIL